MHIDAARAAIHYAYQTSTECLTNSRATSLGSIYVYCLPYYKLEFKLVLHRKLISHARPLNSGVACVQKYPKFARETVTERLPPAIKDHFKG
jgi:hypothetical protein